MRRLQTLKQVSWASDLDLCQVRLFLSEESPSQVGLNSQDNLQAKTSLSLRPGGAGSDDILPPGFEGTHASSQFEIKPSQIPVIKWITPQKIVLNVTWRVVSGEESKEAEDQRQREMRVLEAIYPRISSIPLNPSVSMDVEESHCIDGQTALIPITPIEDEDAAAETLSYSLEPFDVSQSLQLASGVLKDSNSATSMQLACGLSSDVAVAASVALTNLVKSNEHGNFIDHELLNNILNNPEVIEKLVGDFGAINNSQYVHNAGSSLAAFSNTPMPIQGQTTTPSSVVFSSTSSYTPPIGGQAEPVTTQWPPRPSVSSAIVSSSIEAPPARDVNYYKSLIQQHGGHKQETLPYSSKRQIPQAATNYETTSHNHRGKVSKPKIMKPCIFFNSSRGCRNGANCAYQHDASFEPRGNTVSGIQSSKRMKMDHEISN